MRIGRVKLKAQVQAACRRHIHAGKLLERAGALHVEVGQFGHHLDRRAVIAIGRLVQHIKHIAAAQIQPRVMLGHRINGKREVPHAPSAYFAGAAVAVHVCIIAHKAHQLPNAAPIHHFRRNVAARIGLHQRINRAADVVIHHV